MYTGSLGGVRGGVAFDVVNLGHPRMRFLSSSMPILFRGSTSKMRPRMASSSADNGSIELKNLGLFRYAL